MRHTLRYPKPAILIAVAVIAPSTHAQLWPGESLLIPRAGGTVSTAGGQLSLNAPVDAVGVDTLSPIIPNGNVPLNPFFVLDTAYSIGPPGTKFAKPVALSIAWDPRNIPTGLTAADLKIYSIVGHKWTKVPNSVVQVMQQTVTAPISATGTYGILASTTASFTENRIVYRFDDSSDPHFYSCKPDGSDTYRLPGAPLTQGFGRTAVSHSLNAAFWGQPGPFGLDGYVCNIDGSGPRKLTSLAATNGNGQDLSSPDGLQAVVSFVTGGIWRVMRLNADGSGQTQIGTGGSTGAPTYNWEGTRVAFADDTTITVVNSSTGATVATLTPGGSNIADLAFKPGGSVIAFAMDVAGKGRGIYTIPTAGGAVVQRSACKGDARPVYSPSGSQIAYVSLRDDNISLRGIYVISSSALNMLGARIVAMPSTDREMSLFWR